MKQKGAVLNAMLREIEMQKYYLQDISIDTIYFGGGTPSLLTADEISVLVEAIYKNFDIQELKECTLEANPDDLNLKYLKALHKTSVNRLSIGVQSFRQPDLLYMHRAHNAQQAEYAIKAAQDTGFTNLSIDLIYGVPGLSDEVWKQNILKLQEFSVPHFSAYALTVESKTALYHAIINKKTMPVDTDQAANQFILLINKASEMGYDQYEISNFALPGKHAIHNTNYWLNEPYIGIGPAAHSFNGNKRRWNIANNALYAQSINDKNIILAEEEILKPTDLLNEYIMTSLRTIWGLDLSKITKQWGIDYTTKLVKDAQMFIDKNWLRLDENKMKLTLEGKLFADKIASELFFL